jgi:hypothetical protein
LTGVTLSAYAFRMNTKISRTDLAARVKAWRGKVPARQAAELLEVPYRTLQNVEAGRGFPYPKLLLIALRVIRIENK